jgi:serine O-acetyltransferase
LSRCFCTRESFRYSLYLRQCRFHLQRRSRPAFRFFAFLLKRYKYAYGFDIPAECDIGPGLYICHFGGVIVNPAARLGANININHGVTIGQTNRGSRKGVPSVGNRVWFGAYSIVVGRIRVGDNVLIAPGAYVNFDVPDNAVVMGNPGRIVSSAGTEGYLHNLWPENERISRQEPMTGATGSSATNEPE